MSKVNFPKGEGIKIIADSSQATVNDSVYILPFDAKNAEIIVRSKTGLIRKVGALINSQTYTVATLPTGTLGQESIVTDATSPTYLGVLVGGGTVVCPVFHNGVAWKSR